jgi:hypothetical protein
MHVRQSLHIRPQSVLVIIRGLLQADRAMQEFMHVYSEDTLERTIVAC